MLCMLQLHAGPDLGGGGVAPGLPPTRGLPPNPSIFLANDRCLPCLMEDFEINVIF